MAFFDIFRRSDKKLLDTTKPNQIDDFGLYGTQLQVMDRHKIFEILDECGIEYQDSRKSPHASMKLSRMAFDTIPFVKRVIEDMAAMVGNVKIVVDGAEEDSLKEVNRDLSKIGILNERDWITPHQRGIDNIVYRISRDVLRNGMVFAQDRVATRGGTRHQGTLLFDPEHFWFVKEDEGPYKLRYGADQYVTRDDLFHLVGYDYIENDQWARPLLAGGGFFLEILVSILVGIKNVNIRKGAPLTLTAVALKDDSVLREESTKKAYKDGMTKLESRISEAIQMQAKGRAANVVAKTPAQIELMNHAFGSESLEDVNPDILSMILVGFANLLKVPPELMGVVLGGSGFSPERFKVLSHIWFHHIDNLREIVKPVARQIITNYMAAEGVDSSIIENFEIEFESANLSSDEDKAAIKKTQAETDKMNTETAAALNEVDTNAGKAFLIRSGLIEG